MKHPIDEIIDEQKRQRNVNIEKGLGPHPTSHTSRDLASAAVCYAMAARTRMTGVSEDVMALIFTDNEFMINNWPWPQEEFNSRGVRKDLVYAAALILACLEVLDVEQQTPQETLDELKRGRMKGG